MPRIRTRAKANEPITLSSDDEEDAAPQTSRRSRRSRRAPVECAETAGPSQSQIKAPVATVAEPSAWSMKSLGSSALNEQSGRKRNIEEIKSVETDTRAPSECTRSSKRMSGVVVSPKLNTEERFKLDIKMLTEKFGTESDGYGIKVVTSPMEMVAYVIIIPKISQARLFNLVLLSQGAPVEMKSLKFFPPVRVRVEVSATATKFFVNASWLSKIHLENMTKEMSKVYRCHAESSPVIAAVDWLETKGIEESGCLFHRTLYYATPDVRRKESFHIPFDDINMIQQMFTAVRDAQENRAKTSSLRGLTAFDCTICFEHKSVMTAVVFPGCNHYFCSTCVRQDISLKIKENRILEIQCLADQCEVPAPTETVKALVDGITFKQYCDFSAESLVGGPTFIRCPRKECSAPMELPAVDAALEVQCLECRHRFCSTCKAKPHPRKPCLTDAQKREIREQYSKGDVRAKRELEERYGVDNVKFALQDAESEAWIAKNAKPCPKCKTNIEKTDGCNKMVCTAKGCNAYFCWLCGQELTGPNPYAHFESGTCAERLHEGESSDEEPTAPYICNVRCYHTLPNGHTVHYTVTSGPYEDSE